MFRLFSEDVCEGIKIVKAQKSRKRINSLGIIEVAGKRDSGIEIGPDVCIPCDGVPRVNRILNVIAQLRERQDDEFAVDRSVGRAAR